MGASPELLLETIKNSSGDNIYSTDALAGTQVASSNKDLSRSWTAKEVEEHKLVTDGIVEDLTTYGATKIATSPLTNKRAGHLFHRFQSISFQTNKPQGVLDCLHPTAALCGLSREEARQWIIDHEGQARGFYGGYFALRQNKAYYAWVNLRSAEFFDNCTVLHVGAGLTKDSSPEEEWLETKEKTQTMLKVLHS
jgi:isochorismate synthase